MTARGVDFILCPPAPGTAPLAGDVHYWYYTSVWNLLDMPGAIFPSTLRVDQELDVVEQGYTPRNEDDEREYNKCKQAIRLGHAAPRAQRDTQLIELHPDSPEVFVDAPISLQLVGKRYCDEAVLAAARVVDNVLRDIHTPSPRPMSKIPPKI